MNRLLVAGLAATGAAALAVPTAFALAAAPSFSQQIPVRVPAGAAQVDYDDRGAVVEARHSSTSPGTPTSSTVPSPGAIDDHGARRGSRSVTRTAEAGDDNGGGPTTRSAEPGDDHGRSRTRSAEPGDDHGGDRTTAHSAEPGDDHGASSEPGDDRGGRSATRTAEPGDDHRGSRGGSGSGSGSDGGSGHGGHGGDD